MTISYWLKNSLLTLTSIATFTSTLHIRAGTWQSELTGGGTAQVDSRTHKAVINQAGNITPLWDGVHKMADGTTVIVNDGVAIPNASMYHTWSKTDNSKDNVLKQSACVQLTRRVCGAKNSCTEHKACELAHQLQSLVKDDLVDNNAETLASSVPNECQKGLANKTAFPPCAEELEPPIACTRLVIKTCGDNAQCQDTTACDAAQQLLHLAQEAALKNPEIANESGPEQYCREAIHNRFFALCQVESTITPPAKN